MLIFTWLSILYLLILKDFSIEFTRNRIRCYWESYWKNPKLFVLLISLFLIIFFPFSRDTLLTILSLKIKEQDSSCTMLSQLHQLHTSKYKQQRRWYSIIKKLDWAIMKGLHGGIEHTLLLINYLRIESNMIMLKALL